MAPAHDFPTFSSNKPYQTTEGLELLIVAAIVAGAIVFMGCIYCVCRCCVCRCCQCAEEGAELEEGAEEGRCAKCKDIFKQGLSAVFDVIEPAKENDQLTFLFSKRRPKSGCCYGYVWVYFTTLFVFLFLLFLSMFCNFFIYRKTSTCNDINVKRKNYICFDINHGYRKVDCLEEKDDNLDVICYLTDFDFFRALGIAYGAIEAFRALISTFFSIGIVIGKKAPGAMITYQIISVILSIILFGVIYGVFHEDCTSGTLCGNAVLLHMTVILAFLTSQFFVVGHPWWAFDSVSHFEKVITELGQGQRLIIIDEEYQPQAPRQNQQETQYHAIGECTAINENSPLTECTV